MTVPADQRVAQLAGVQRFRAASYYTAANVAEWNYAGALTIFCLVSVSRVFDTTTVYSYFRHGASIAINTWHFYYQNGDFRCSVHNGTTNVLQTIPYVPRPGEILVVALSTDGTTQRMRLGEIDTRSDPLAGGTAAGTDAVRIGNRPGGTPNQPATPFVVHAALGTGSQGLDDADLLTTIRELVDNAEQGRSLDAGLSVFAPEDYIDLADAWQGPGAPAKVTVNARIGGSSFVKTGEPEPSSHAARF